MAEEIYNYDGSCFSEETKLHKAIKYIRQDLFQDWFDSKRWEDVNVGNRWHQTPLHYCAIHNIKGALADLLQVPGVDFKKQDLNGYNVLHSFIYNIATVSDWRRTILVLLSLGIDINQQTKHGYTILHLASRQTTLSCVLRFILESCSGLKVTMVNKDRENFLHSFVQSLNKTSPISDEFKERFLLLKDIVRGKIPCCDDEKLKALLKQRDINGTTVFLLMINHFDRYKNVNAIKILRKMSAVGECSTIPDNLGNHPIHYAVACMRKAPFKLLKMLINTGANVNAKNMYDQSTAHLVRIDSKDFAYEKIKLMVKLMKTTGFEFNASDKWGCNLLMYISAFYDSICTLFLKDISRASIIINAEDNNGSTALHHAAYHDSAAFVKILIQNGATKDIQDDLGDIPIETANRHLRISSGKALLKFSKTEELNDEYQKFIEKLKTWTNLLKNFLITNIEIKEKKRKTSIQQFSSF